MELTSLITEKLSSLPDGDHTLGLNAVLSHINTAAKHYERGRRERDDTAFTDSIYRANQAFEGSIKEAYRVLAGKDPSRKTPHEIEQYLESNEVFRDRVLSQFTTYRTEWRNPSTHDYKLDFDPNESFLAIVSVTAFACLLADQIATKLAYLDGRANSVPSNSPVTQQGPLLQRATSLIKEFALQLRRSSVDSTLAYESRFLGELSGFISVAAPDMRVELEVALDPKARARADAVLYQGNERVLLELKLRSRATPEIVAMQVERYMSYSGIDKAILLLNPVPGATLSSAPFESQGSVFDNIIVMQPDDPG